MPRAILLVFVSIALTACSIEPPPGYSALFNGRNLDGWQGLIEPPDRARMSPDQLAVAQAAADQRMRDHWSVKDGILIFDGRGENLCTKERFKDFDLLVDWKIQKGGDSGIYLRGSPQVQIWDNPVGSGGLYNNKLHPSNPLVVADHPPGEWNHFRIVMQGQTVTVWLNGRLVVDHVPMENYWERAKPIYPEGAIELQNHGSLLEFRNIYVKRLSAAAPAPDAPAPAGANAPH
jgi:hypothetical protein